jgi:hypothetical protein
MKPTYLIPSYLRILGFACLILALIGGYYLAQNPKIPKSESLFYLGELILIFGMILTIWSRFKREDEWTSHLRFSSSLQAIAVSALYFLFTYSCIYGFNYWYLSLFNPIIPFVSYFFIFWIKFLYQHWRSGSE